MNTYQKAAIFVLRLVSVCWTLFFAFAWSLYGIEAWIGVEVQHYATHNVVGSVGYIVLGIAFTAASRPLGRFIGRGLSD